MSNNLQEFQYLLQDLRTSFLDDLEDRCDTLDNMAVALEKAPTDRDLFNRLYREVHNMKGLGGMHNLHVITTICHQMENCLADAVANATLGAVATHVLDYVDLLRRVEEPARMAIPDFTALEADMEKLRQAGLKSHKVCLIAEPSSMMVSVYQTALARAQIQSTVARNGLEALTCLLHSPFDFAIVGRELEELNGIAVVSALRMSRCKNQDMPVVMVTSNLENIPQHAKITAVLPRDHHLPDNLGKALAGISGKK